MKSYWMISFMITSSQELGLPGDLLWQPTTALYKACHISLANNYLLLLWANGQKDVGKQEMFLRNRQASYGQITTNQICRVYQFHTRNKEICMYIYSIWTGKRAREWLTYLNSTVGWSDREAMTCQNIEIRTTQCCASFPAWQHQLSI